MVVAFDEVKMTNTLGQVVGVLNLGNSGQSYLFQIYHISPRPPEIVGHIHLLTKTPESYG